MKQQSPIFFRPEWTCGRYNEPNKAAIMYNLIEGQSYFFEEHSASVIGEILSVPRNNPIAPSIIEGNTGIHIDSIIEFMEELLNIGLVVVKSYSKEEIRELKKQIASAQYIDENKESDELMEYDTTNAEQAYSDVTYTPNSISTVMLELTYNCSEKCIHCYNAGAARNDNEANLRPRSEMNLNDYKRVIDELYDLGLYKVCLTGGDPFSKPIVWEIISYLYEKNIAFDIYTNGQSITHKIDQLLEYYPRFIGLSIYSAIDEVHDKITRIKDSLKKTLYVAEQLSTYAVPMSFKCVILKTNVKSYYTVSDLAERYGAIAQFEVNLCNSVDGDISVVNNLRLPVEALEVVLRDKRIPLYVGEELPNYGGYPKELTAHPCRAGMGTFNITPDGELTPCCTFPTSFGNVVNTPLPEIISQSIELKQWQKVKISDIESCAKEDKCAFCMLCAGNSFIEYGTPLKPSSLNCFMAEVRYNIAQKLKQGNDPLNGLTVEERLTQISIEDIEHFNRIETINYRNHKLALK